MKKRFKYLLATVAAGFSLLVALFASLHFYIITTTVSAPKIIGLSYRK